MALTKGFEALAITLQEQAEFEIGHNDLQQWLRDACGTCGCWLVNFIGDDEDGDVIVSCNGDLKRIPYEITTVNGKVTAQLDMDNAMDVLPRTVYEPEADEADHYASMESQRLYKDAGSAKLAERFISKAERNAADSGSFAGKGKSYPLLKPGDVGAAVHAMGRAGADNYDTGTLKRNIIRIAKAKGWGKYLPKAWQDGGSSKESLREAKTSPNDASMTAHSASMAAKAASETAKEEKTTAAYKKAGKAHAEAASAHYQAAALQYGDGKQDLGRDHTEKAIKHQTEASQLNENGFSNTAESGTGADTGDLALVEAAATTETIVLQEARADYEIKLIAPGKGSSAYYPAEVLQRDGPKVFTKETKVFLNHQTDAEEAARPEGDVNNLAGVLTSDAVYKESHPKGPGLYARMKVFADHAKTVEEKAPHLGMSIRASGTALKEGNRVAMKEGVPVLASLLSRKSVDVVTEAGAGGMILTESARVGSTNSQEAADSMTPQEQKEFKELREAAQNQAAELKRLRERQATTDAATEIARYFSVREGGVAVGPVIQQRVTRYLMERVLPVTTEGALDTAKLKESIKAATQEEISYASQLNGGRIVTGLGSSAATAQLSEADRAAQEQRLKEARKEFGKQFASTMGARTKMGRKILMEGRGAFDPNYNALFHGAKPTPPGMDGGVDLGG